MPTFQNSRIVQHSARQMFDLVADVERYPEFVPLCHSLVIQQRQGEELVARMTVAYKMVRESFVTRVLLQSQELTIVVSYLDGPFSHLENKWVFEPIGEGRCRVFFYINYQFKSRALGVIMGAAFDRAFRKFSEAFEKRADFIYSNT